MRRAAFWFACIFGVAGVGVLVRYAPSFPLIRIPETVGFAIGAAVFGGYRVKLPGRAYPTLGSVFVLLSYAQGGIATAALVQVVETLVSLWGSSKLTEGLFQVGQRLVSLLILHVTVSSLMHGSADPTKSELALLFGSGLYFVVSLVFITLWETLKADRPFVEVASELLEDSYRGLLLCLALLLPVHYTFERAGWTALVFLAGSLLAMGVAVNLFLEQRRVNLDTLHKLSNLLARKTGAAENHAARVANLARIVAETLGLPADETQTIYAAGMLHDIGEADVDPRVVSIMTRHAIPTLADLAAYKEHPLLGERLVAEMEGMAGAALLVRHHHEAWDGSGYPDGLKGLDIPVGARILAAAEFVESLPEQDLSTRLVRLTAAAGTLLDPDLLPSVRNAVTKLETPTRKIETMVTGADAATLQTKLAQAVRSSRVLETLGVSRILSYEQGRFTNFRGESAVVPVREQVAQLAEQCLREQFPVSNVVTAEATGFYVHCIPAGDHSCSILMFDVSEALAVEREHTRQLFRAYRDVIAAATHGGLLLMDATARDALLAEGELWAEMTLAHVSDGSAARTMIDRFAGQFGLPSQMSFQLKVCMSEAITNVFKHAGRGTLAVRTGPGFVRVIVRDQGDGIPFDILPKAVLTDGYSTQRSLGKGFTVMLKYLDRLYLHTSADGTVLVLEKALAEAEMSSAAEGGHPGQP